VDTYLPPMTASAVQHEWPHHRPKRHEILILDDHQRRRGVIPLASMNIFAPNTKNRTDAAICVHFRGMSVGSRWRIAADRMDMTTREPNAPAKTSIRG